MTGKSPFHEGEQLVQTRLGVRDEIEPWARKVVRPFLTEQHREFYAELPFLVAAARDERGRPWVTLLAGEPGFARSDDPATLTIAALPAAGDALADAMTEGSDVGFLGIELAERRRNRVNGRVSERNDTGFVLQVEQSFGNCPQYIIERSWRMAPPSATGPVHRVHERLPARLRRFIGRADTFFIATGHRGEGESSTFGMDASHRGGEPGFVLVEGDRELVFPDYAGNNHFNTIGNLLLDPRAGFLFVDFERGDLIQLTGRTSIDWGSPELERFPGARRLVRFAIEEVVELRGALPIRWGEPNEAVRELRVISVVPESEDVSSFVFESRDGGPLPDFLPGQHLPIELAIPGHERTVGRTYSLSNGPGGSQYRISVKREPLGLASRHLHDHVRVGSFVEARSPRGDFTFDAESERPAVLVSAGVGLTPMVSMLHSVAARVDGPSVWFVHGARDGRHHSLAAEVRQVAGSSPHVNVHVAYSRPRDEDVLGRDFDSVGRVDAAGLEKLVPGLDADFYLCGPPRFMAGVQQGLEERGVPDERIHTESFGPTA